MRTRHLVSILSGLLLCAGLLVASFTPPASASGSEITGASTQYLGPNGSMGFYGMVSDASGNIFASTGNALYEFTGPTTSMPGSPFATLPNSQYGYQIGLCGTSLYVATNQKNVYKVDLTNPQPIVDPPWGTVASNVYGSAQMGCDDAGNVYLSLYSKIVKISASGGAATDFATGYDAVSGIAISGDTIYFSDSGSNQTAGPIFSGSITSGQTNFATWNLGPTVSAANPCRTDMYCPLSVDSDSNLFVVNADGTGHDVFVVPADESPAYFMNITGVPSDLAAYQIAPSSSGFYLQGDQSGQGYAGNVTLTYPVTLSAPRSPVAYPGDAQATVSWLAPATGTPTGYTVTATPGGATCSSTDALFCTVSGLTNGTAYTFTVVATAGSATGPDSSATSSVTPSNSGASTPLTAASGSVTELAPGAAATFLAGGQVDPLSVVAVDATTITVGNGTTSMSLSGTSQASGVLTMNPGASGSTSGFGFLPGSVVTVFCFSSPTVLGHATVGDDGRFTFTFPVPSSLAPGNHTVQAQGVDINGAPRALLAGVEVGASMAATGSELSTGAWLGALLVVGGFLMILLVRKRLRSATR